MQTALGIILLVSAVFLVIAVLMQHGKQKNLSGTIAGGAETFFGKSKGRAIDSILSKVTTGVSIFFVLVVIAVYVMLPNIKTNIDTVNQPGFAQSQYYASTHVHEDEADDTTAADTTAAAAADTTAAPAADTTAAPAADTTAEPAADTTAAPVADTTAAE